MNEWNSSPRPRRKKLRAVASSSWNNPSTRCHNDVLILLLPLLITKLIIINPAARLAHYVSYSPWGLPSQGRECASALRPSRGSRRQTARIRRCGTLVYLVAQSETRVCVPRHWLVTSTVCPRVHRNSAPHGFSRMWCPIPKSFWSLNGHICGFGLVYVIHWCDPYTLSNRPQQIDLHFVTHFDW